MKICVFGAGAIGGYMAVKMAAEHEVSIVARGPHLAAIKANGLTLISEGKTEIARIKASADPAELGPQDFVVIGLKAHQLATAAPTMKPLLGPETALVTAMNGVPWWYFHGLGGPHQGHRLESVDPGGVVSAHLDPARAIGCIVYPAAEITAPGVVNHTFSNRFAIGEPSGEKTARIAALADAMVKSGFQCPIRPRIRDDLWVKLWGNLCFNPISMLTHATLDVIATEPGSRAVARAMMREAQAVGEALGVRFAIDVEKRIDGAASVGAHKTSMLQDLERGKPVELEALLGAVVEMARLTGKDTPLCDAILALARQRARVAGLL